MNIIVNNEKVGECTLGTPIEEIKKTHGDGATLVKTDEEKMLDTDYNGTSVSLTSKDQNGLIAVKTAFELGATRTVFKFQNGTKMEMTPTIFAEFAPWFVEKRNEFFQE